MRAIIITDGIIQIYVLRDNGLSEVEQFLRYSNEKSIVNGFIDRFATIAENGIPPCNTKYFKSFKKGKTKYCQFMKGDHRISCFRYSNRLLLVTYFRKTRQSEEREYKKAIRIKERFDENQIWEDFHGTDG